MRLASQLSFISVGIGVVMVIYGLIRFFKQRAELKRNPDSERSNDGG